VLVSLPRDQLTSGGGGTSATMDPTCEIFRNLMRMVKGGIIGEEEETSASGLHFEEEVSTPHPETFD